MLENQLRKIGLSDKEARVYLASLRMGKSPANDIAKQANVNRATTYVIIEALIRMGLMTSYEKNDKAYFTAESPERLMSLIKKQEQSVQEKKQELSTLLPDLLSMYSSADNKPRVKFFEGIEGLRAIQEEYLKSKEKEILDICCLDSLYDIMPNIGNDYTPRRVKKGIHAKLLYTSKKGVNKVLEETDAQFLRESRYIPYDQFPFQTDITILGNKVSMESYEGRIIAILIEDKGIADSMRAVFNYLWNTAAEKK